MSGELVVQGQSELATRVEREVGARFKQLTTLLGTEEKARRFARTLVLASDAKNSRGDLVLAKCSTASIVQTALDAARIGLEVGGPRAHAALVPYGSEAKLLVMVAGWLAVAKREGAIVDAQVILVHEGEQFVWDPTADRPVIHRPSWGLDEPGDVVAAYVILTLPGGLKLTEVVPGYYLSKVEKFARSKAGNRQTPWDEWREEMIKKTALRKVLSRHLDAVSTSSLESIDSAPIVEPVKLTAAIEEPVEDPKPAPRRRAQAATVEAQPEPRSEPKVEETKPTETKPVRDRIYRLLKIDGVSQADADAEIKQAFGDAPTDQQLEEWLARGCK